MWAAGVIFYMLVSGRYPFWDCPWQQTDPKMDPHRIMSAIVSCGIRFRGPEWETGQLASLVSGMLDRNPQTRLTAADALNHKWFQRYPAPAPAPGCSPFVAPRPHVSRADRLRQQWMEDYDGGSMASYCN